MTSWLRSTIARASRPSWSLPPRRAKRARKRQGQRHGALSPSPGRGAIEVQIENASGADWTSRDVLWPGKQIVTASRLMILDKGQTARGEKVVVYASMGQALKDTITALIHYPFG